MLESVIVHGKDPKVVHLLVHFNESDSTPAFLEHLSEWTVSQRKNKTKCNCPDTGIACLTKWSFLL